MATETETTARRLADAWIAAVRELDAGTLTVERYTTRCEAILALAESTDAGTLTSGLMWDMIRAAVQS